MCFNFHFPSWIMMLSIFSCAYLPPVYLLWWNIYSFAHLKKLNCFLSFERSSNIGGINPLSDIVFKIILSLFVVLRVIHRAEVLTLMRSVYWFVLLWIMLHVLLNLKLQKFSSRSFRILVFTFRSMIHFELKFCMCCEVYSEANFFFLSNGYSIFPTIFVEDCINSLLNCLSTCVENQ